MTTPMQFKPKDEETPEVAPEAPKDEAPPQEPAKEEDPAADEGHPGEGPPDEHAEEDAPPTDEGHPEGQEEPPVEEPPAPDDPMAEHTHKLARVTTLLGGLAKVVHTHMTNPPVPPTPPVPMKAKQVTALQNIIEGVTWGRIPRQAAIAMIVKAFPQITPDEATAMVSPDGIKALNAEEEIETGQDDGHDDDEGDDEPDTKAKLDAAEVTALDETIAKLEAERRDLDGQIKGVKLALDYDEDQPRDSDGKFSSGGGGGLKLNDEKSGGPIAKGTTFHVLRVAHKSEDGLDNRNAGNVPGIASYIDNAEDYEKPSYQNIDAADTHVHVYEVHVGDDFGQYSQFDKGRGGHAADKVGRTTPTDAAHGVWYSFPKGGNWSAKKIASVPLKDIKAHLKTIPSKAAWSDKPYFSDKVGWHGVEVSSNAIRDFFDKGKRADYSDDQPRDEGGRFAAAGGGAGPAAHKIAHELLHQSGGDIHAALASFHGEHVPETLHGEHDEVPTAEVHAALKSYQPSPISTEGREMVTVHHSTSPEKAALLTKQGVIPEAKPVTLARERFENGEQATFSPGAGLSGGTYVGAPGTTEGFGRATVEMKVPKEWLSVPPELHGIETDPMKALHTEHGALITRPVPPGLIRNLDDVKHEAELTKGNIGIPREKMPQIAEKDVPEFFDHLKGKGIEVNPHQSAIVSDLKPTQSSMNMEKVRGMAAKMPPAILAKPVITSNDNHILDGHHRWAALKINNPQSTIAIHRVNVPIHQLVTEALAFPKSGRRTVKDKADDEERDEHGRWTSGGGSGGTYRADYQSKLSTGERSACLEYANMAYVKVNESLRSGKTGDRRLVEALDSAIAKSRVPTETVVYRGIQEGRDPLAKFKPGSVITDRGYVSTTGTRKVAEEYADGEGETHILMRIRVPAGHPAAPIPSRLSEEDEYLLPRNSKFRIVGATKEGNSTIVDAEAL